MSSQGRDILQPPTPPGVSYVPSSWSSALGVSEALASYRRSQYIITGQHVPSSVETSSLRIEDVEEGPPLEEEGTPRLSEVGEEEEEDLTPLPTEEPVISNLEWDEDIETPANAVESVPPRPSHRKTPSRHQRIGQWRTDYRTSPPSAQDAQRFSPPTEASTEQTPLLKNASTVTLKLSDARHDSELVAASSAFAGPRPSFGAQDGKGPLKRTTSSVSTRSEKPIPGGRSTFGQTMFNSIAILLGFGMLSEPLAFAYAGWICGSLLLISYGLVTCYTGKILARAMLEDPQLRTYADIGNKAFGQRARFLTGTLFCLELFSVSVLLVTLYADSLHSIVPTYSADTYKLIGLIILLPSIFVPLSFLSYASILGILSTLLIITVLLFDGLSKHTPPGSLWRPADTSLDIASFGELGTAFGLIMAGYSGHAVLPSLARDMVNPKEFDAMINWAFLATTVIYGVIGASGYLMFGNSVSDEVSKDMLATPGYNATLNKIAVWSLVIMPLTKFALTTRPVNIALEITFGLESNTLPQISESDNSVSTISTIQRKRPRLLNNFLIFVERIVFALMAVAVSIFIPDFSVMMAFLGSFSAFMLCVIGPVSAKVALAGKCSWLDAALLLVAVVMAAWGTITAFTT